MYFYQTLQRNSMDWRCGCPFKHPLVSEGETSADMLNYEQLIDNADAIAPLKSDYNNLASIFYTGGTTEFPKGVMLSHTNLWSSSIVITAEIGLNVAGERYLHVAPMFHIADVGVSYAMLIGGLCQVFVPCFERKTVIDVIDHKKINHVLLVPTRGVFKEPWGERFEITPIAAPGSKVYEMLQQGVIDRVFNPMDTQKSLHLYEVAPNILAVPGGMYLGSFSIFINPDFLASLPKKIVTLS